MASVNSILSSFLREANATPYAAGDVVSAAAALAVPAMVFPNAGRLLGGNGTIVAARIITNTKSVVPRIRVHLFNDNSATVSGDNLPYRELYADVSKRCGYFDFPAMITGTDTANSDMSRAVLSNIRIPYVCAANSQSLFAVLETLDAFTPTSGSAFSLVLVTEQN